MNAMKKIIGITLAGFMLGAAAQATALYDFESGGQGWGSFGPLTTDSGPTTGSVGQGRYHAADFDLAGWGIVSVSPSTDLSSYTGLSIDALLGEATGFTPFSGTAALDIGVEVSAVEYYAPAVILSDSFATYSVNFADFVPGGTDLSSAIIKLRMLKGTNTGVGVLRYDEVTGVPEPMSLTLLGLGLFLVRRR